MIKIYEALERARFSGARPAASRGAPHGPEGARELGRGISGETAQAEVPQEPRAAGRAEWTARLRRVATVKIQLEVGAPLFPFDGSHPSAAEQYKIARTKILRHWSQPKSLVISSVQVGDGKTVTAINLAGCLALKPETTVLLVEGDLRRGQIARLLGVEPGCGLAEVLFGKCRLEEALLRLDPFPNLYLLAGGAKPDNPTELLDAPAFRALAKLLRQAFDFVIWDAPPVGLVADFDLIQEVCDGVVLVMRPDHTNRPRCLQALGAFPPEKLVGVVLNCVSEWFLTRPYGYYHYDYYYEKPERKRASEPSP